MKLYMDEPTNVETFQKFWREELSSLSSTTFDAFVENMKQLKMKDHTYTSWIKIWLAWNELSSDDDIDMMYGGDHNTFMEMDE